MVPYKLLTGLLVASLLSINWRISKTRRVSTKIPDSINPDAVIQALHDHKAFIALNPVIVDLTQVQTDPVIYENEWFQTPETQDPIETYMINSIITIIPVSYWGKHHIQFPTWLRNTETGVKTKADAPLGVIVGSQLSVQPENTGGWMLVVDLNVKCVWWVMPFVAWTYDQVYANIVRDLLKSQEGGI
ncbi:hypothetical protein BO94DRAFT_38548 [Aspergillus sclerotioniger CBS 115572]|uniref:DUF7053 domain-containing protein n=1 Tax=Aspergillus sclerotioniger CBS 115572 TaxID=1450535 RepID=A0A317WXJ4_9EURO|nr:hypothetical protein BO94DRAFT_38548 [Aspergillus sclerotioniger CBS 115572]PWY89508.1 hypothetical protein BO94DRAFT_38548 [Aspergillus sclerotioniger CBS 115572]